MISFADPDDFSPDPDQTFQLGLSLDPDPDLSP
jgi:hypothetical protein